MSRIGPNIRFWPSLYNGEKQVTGEVVYVHPKRRFVRVRFTSVDFFGRTTEHFECLKIIDGQIDKGRGKAYAEQP
ncbi:MAG: hypothetical protein IJ042_09725 [Butyricicoccus sp.]|nr:hypothetical protein [Butyricicoccus sp.]